MPHTQVHSIGEGAVREIQFRGPGGIQVLSETTRFQLEDVLEQIETDADQIRLVEFTASGRTFIAGADIRELADLDESSALRLACHGQAMMQRIADLPMPTIAWIQGVCAGGGLELALACNVRIATRQARLGLPEAGLGILPGWGGTVRTRQLLNPATALRLTLTGELIEAEEALRIGLVSSVVHEDQLQEKRQTFQQQLLKQSPGSLREIKQLITNSGEDLQTEFHQEARAFARCFREDQAKLGLGSFLRKTTPPWASETPADTP